MRTSITLSCMTLLASIVAGCAVDAAPAPAVETQPESVAQASEAVIITTPRLEDLAAQSLEAIEKQYQAGTTEGGLPEGQGIGRALFTGLPGLAQLEEQLRLAGVPSARAVEDLIANNVWHGKLFHRIDGDPNRIGMLTNDVFGLQIATADIRYIGASTNADEANTFYLDYSQSNLFLVRTIQDYIRKVGPDLYLGKAFITLPGAKERILGCYFALDFSKK